jgi:hypothetical protein
MYMSGGAGISTFIRGIRMFIFQRLHKTIGRTAFNARVGMILLSILVTAALFSPNGVSRTALSASPAASNAGSRWKSKHRLMWDAPIRLNTAPKR